MPAKLSQNSQRSMLSVSKLDARSTVFEPSDSSVEDARRHMRTKLETEKRKLQMFNKGSFINLFRNTKEHNKTSPYFSPASATYDSPASLLKMHDELPPKAIQAWHQYVSQHRV